MATLRHNVANLISVPITMASLCLKKALYPRNLYFSGIQRFSPSVVVDLDRKSKVRFENRVSMHSRCRIAATSGGELYIGSRTSFNIGCIVTSRFRIKIGNNGSFGPNVMIYDHDHIMETDIGAKGFGFKLDEVIIDDNCWIGAGTIILRGTHIGRNSVIAAGSVVKGDIPENTVLVQKRVNTYRKVE